MLPVILVSVPYAALQHPSPALGCLQACLKQRGIHSETVHANLEFARLIGIGNYAWFGTYARTILLGEFTFARAAFPEFDPPMEDYVAALQTDGVERPLRDMREAAVSFIDTIARQIIGMNPRIVGCSSTFQQNCASLALLRRIRALKPRIVTVMGGANCESEMGRAVHSNFSWVDYVVSGEADDVFPSLCEHILSDKAARLPAELRRYVLSPETRAFGRMRAIERATQSDMDSLPLPDYDDYFRALRATGIHHFATPGLLLQTARGCWWGEKHPCTFCGLNGGCMTFRPMRPAVAERRIRQLADRYDIDGVELIDNILEPSYFEGVLPSLATMAPRLRLACEVKANLTRAQIQLLANAGAHWVQPGIESLHDEALKLIDKGTTLCQNIQTLKWGRELGVHMSWNYLLGFPREEPDWYTAVAELVPLLTHLQPPMGPGSKVVFDRFSVYHTHADEFDLKLTPAWGYSFVYPLPASEMQDLAYHFEDSSPAAAERAQCPQRALLREQLRQWADLHPEPSADPDATEPPAAPPRLDVSSASGGRLIIEDTRPCAPSPRVELSGLAACLYDACDRGRLSKTLLPVCHEAGFPDTTADDIERELARLIEAKLLVHATGRFLSLAVRAPYPPFLPLDMHPDGQVYLRPVVRARKPQEQTVSDMFQLDRPSPEAVQQ
jgi:ribosomal peptide maturation radical SAM protein 1